ncbi:hypothetical protein K439DRAFT_1344924, partial [Ramaria rubella]
MFKYSSVDPIQLFATETNDKKSRPFQCHVLLTGTKQQPTVLKGIADGGAMMNTIDLSVWKATSSRLGELTPSQTQAKMADSTIVPSRGRWVGQVSLHKASACGSFAILEVRGALEVLLGKPWLAAAGLTQGFATDTLR